MASRVQIALRAMPATQMPDPKKGTLKMAPKKPNMQAMKATPQMTIRDPELMRFQFTSYKGAEKYLVGMERIAQVPWLAPARPANSNPRLPPERKSRIFVRKDGKFSGSERASKSIPPGSGRPSG